MSRWLNETTSQKNFPARISVRMRVRIFSPGWRRMMRFKSGYFSRKRLLSGAESGVFIAVYHTTSRSPPAGWVGRAGACARVGPAPAPERSAESRHATLTMFLDMLSLPECRLRVQVRLLHLRTVLLHHFPVHVERRLGARGQHRRVFRFLSVQSELRFRAFEKLWIGEQIQHGRC